MMRYVALSLLLVGCTAAEQGLGPTSIPGDAGTRPGDAGPVDAGPGPTSACEGLEALPARNRRELLRLGTMLSDTVIEVRAEAPASDPRGLATAVVTRVHRGHAFLQGQRVRVELDGATAARAAFPRDLILGLDEPGLPVRSESGPPELSRVLVAVELGERALVEDLWGYRVGAEPFVAAVEFTGSNDSRVEARVIEPIAGEVPERLVFNWGGPYEADWPGAGSGRYIISFSYRPTPLPDGTFLGSTVDARPFTAEARQDVQDALSNPWPGLDAEGLGQRLATYDMSWRFHRAPRVVATEVSGLADECCTGAGGTYVEHVVQQDLRGNAELTRLVRGGHGYYSEEACGQRHLLGTDPLTAFPMPSAFACGAGSEGLPSGLESTWVHVQRADDAAARAEVQSWLQSPSPHYLLHGAEPFGPPGAPSTGPWSSPVSVTEALALAPLVGVRVVRATLREDGATEVLLQTPFATEFYEHLEVREVRLVFTCGDPRLSVPGTEWLVPLFGQPDIGLRDGGASQGALFLIPGVIFEAEGPGPALAQRVSRLVPRPR